ncbi:MAG TPA: hypothetical protein VHU24_09745 [Solirubrobacterales bacterium]|nr:hypothetical protein [Solirubrobacterales bacterium]
MEASAGPSRTTETAGSQRSKDRAEQEPKHRHRGLVWSLVVLASVVLLVSMLANWIQTQVLNSGEFSNSTEKILQNKDVQQQLSIFAVDQLYANVDVQAQIEQRLPPPAQPLAAPVTAATRQLANNVAETALASPRVQGLVATAINGAQQRFVSLIDNKGQFVSTQGGDVTLEYGSFVADLATRLGVDPSTISQIQGFIQQYSTELKQRLTTIQSKIVSTRATLSQAQAGTLSPQAQQNLTTLETDAAQLHTTVVSLEQKITGIQPKAPAQLQARLSDLQGRLARLDKRSAAAQGQAAAVLKDPSQANILKLDPTLASLQMRVTDLLNRQAIQHPGELVVMKSSGLSGLQDLVKVLRHLGFVLPLLALALYLAAIYLAKGWRRETLMRAGGGILGAALVVLLTRRLLGSAVTDSVASSDAVKPAVTAVWNIISAGLRERAVFVLVIGLGFIGGGLLAGPGRHEVAVRRFLAPYLREQPVVVYAVLAFIFLLWLTLLPTINNLGQVLVVLILAALAVVGVEILRRQTAREFPNASTAPGGER